LAEGPPKSSRAGQGLELIQAEKPPKVDPLALEERKEFEHLNQKEKLRAKRLANEQLQQDNASRQLYVQRLYTLICCWVGGLFALLFCQGFSIRWFFLSDKVLLALIGGTTLNFLGVFAIVVKYLFTRRDR
jgi:hypothetical protein